MFRLSDIDEKRNLKIAVIAPIFLFSLMEFGIYLSYKSYKEAKELHGTVVKEKFVEGYSSSGFLSSHFEPHQYSMIVRLPDGSTKQFLYEGDLAIEADVKYDINDSIDWKEGYLPGTTSRANRNSNCQSKF